MTTTATRPRKGPTLTRRTVVSGVAALVAAVVVVAVVVGWVSTRGTASAPYADPASSGPVTLCRDGKPVTSGSTSDFPFVAAVVGGKASGAYAASGATATLFAYQPRAGVGPEEWTGLQLTGSLGYADPAAPSLVLTDTDTTLGQFLGGYPAVDDGWVQLRLTLGAPGAPTSATYATADLHVDGTTWRQIDGGHATCPSSAPSN